MLEKEDALPRPEKEAAILYRNAKLSCGQRGTEMSWHVVWSFVAMLIGAALGSKPPEIGL
jgi:hypothetical protein